MGDRMTSKIFRQSCKNTISFASFCIEEIDSLVIRGISSKGETLYEELEAVHESRAESPIEERRLRGAVEEKGTRLRGDLDDRALLHDDHTLTFLNRDDRAVRNNVFTPLGIGAPL